MRFTLTIDTDGAAFDEPGPEVARLLRVAADSLCAWRLASGDRGNLRDTNGNTCGKWAYGVEVTS